MDISFIFDLTSLQMETIVNQKCHSKKNGDFKQLLLIVFSIPVY